MKLSPSAFKLYCILLAFANKDSEAWPKRATLSVMVGVKMRKITYLFRELESYFLLEKVAPEREGVVVKCEEVMAELGTVDAIVTDPPYGMEKGEWDPKDYLVEVGPALRSAYELLADCSPMFVFTSTAEVVNVANALGQPLKRMFWMYKPGDCTYPLAGWLLKSEAILWFRKGDRLQLEERKPYRHDCYVHKRVGLEGVEGHPCVKPLWVVSDLVSRTRIGGTVLDPYVGSGTTLVACVQWKRKAIGIERDEAYCEIAAKRIEEAFRCPALLEVA